MTYNNEQSDPTAGGAMNRIRMVAAGALVAAGVGAWLLRRQMRPPLETVDRLDLERYAGKWYEIARLPTW